MDEHMGETQLIECIVEAADGGYCKLMGWPCQTDLTVKSSHSHGATFESWCPKTTSSTISPTLQWKPFKIVRAIPHPVGHADQIALRGDLRYHKSVGWHHRYKLPFKITGTPSLPDSMKAKHSSSSVTTALKSKKHPKKPSSKVTAGPCINQSAG